MTSKTQVTIMEGGPNEKKRQRTLEDSSKDCALRTLCPGRFTGQPSR